MCIPKLPHCQVISLPHPETLTIIQSLFQCLEYADCSPVSQQCKVLITAPIGPVQICTEGLLSASKQMYILHIDDSFQFLFWTFQQTCNHCIHGNTNGLFQSV